MNATAAAVARLLDDDGRCPRADPPGGGWCGAVWVPDDSPAWHAVMAPHRHVPSTSGRGAVSPRRPAPGTAP